MYVDIFKCEDGQANKRLGRVLEDDIRDEVDFREVEVAEAAGQYQFGVVDKRLIFPYGLNTLNRDEGFQPLPCGLKNPVSGAG